jgi:hypothetical protein
VRAYTRPESAVTRRREVDAFFFLQGAIRLGAGVGYSRGTVAADCQILFMTESVPREAGAMLIYLGQGWAVPKAAFLLWSPSTLGCY